MKTRQDPTTKTYFRCLSCQEFINGCPGIPTRDMDTIEWCEYIDIAMKIKHLSNAYVAPKADVSIKTLERIRAGLIDKDIRRSTARRVELVVFGSVGKYFCDLDYDGSAAAERIKELLAEVEYWRKENDRKAKIIDKYLD